MTATDSQIPKVSVIVSCYNQEKYIAECLESILNQTYSDYEAVIVDDGSTDNSLSILDFNATNNPSIFKLFGRLQSRTYMRKPSRINFSAGNQFLSSSMFRKKDFLKCGGYDREFKSGYEDYDLWLNMIFKQKLKGYLIAEPLLRYRIKDRIESRNLAADSNKKTLYKQLLKKYPLMKWIRVFWKIKKIFYNKRFSQKHNKWNIRILSVINIRYKK